MAQRKSCCPDTHLARGFECHGGCRRIHRWRSPERIRATPSRLRWPLGLKTSRARIRQQPASLLSASHWRMPSLPSASSQSPAGAGRSQRLCPLVQMHQRFESHREDRRLQHTAPRLTKSACRPPPTLRQPPSLSFAEPP
jgi:hypothetical protein